jgi:hypothetical protein
LQFIIAIFLHVYLFYFYVYLFILFLGLFIYFILLQEISPSASFTIDTTMPKNLMPPIELGDTETALHDGKAHNITLRINERHRARASLLSNAEQIVVDAEVALHRGPI